MCWHFIDLIRKLKLYTINSHDKLSFCHPLPAVELNGIFTQDKIVEPSHQCQQSLTHWLVAFYNIIIFYVMHFLTYHDIQCIPFGLIIYFLSKFMCWVYDKSLKLLFISFNKKKKKNWQLQNNSIKSLQLDCKCTFSHDKIVPYSLLCPP